MTIIAKDTPLVEITLRRYERPTSTDKRELVRKLCLSLGLLQPGDSRDVMVDILYVLLTNRNQKMDLTSEELMGEVINLRKRHKLPLKGIAPSNIRRQIRRLRELMIVEKIFNAYRLAEFNKMNEIFEEKIEKFLLSAIVTRVKEYMHLVEKQFSEKQQDTISKQKTGYEGDSFLN